MRLFKKHISFLFMLVLLMSMNVTPVFASSKLTDIEPSDWFYSDVVELVDSGVISGYTDGTFRPRANISTAEALKLIMESTFKKPATLDSSVKTHWAFGYFKTAYEEDIIDVYDYSKIDSPTTRGDVARFLVKSLGYPLNKESKGYFVDTNDLYVETLFDAGIIKGSVVNEKTYYYPDNFITRAETASIIARTQRQVKKEIELKLRNDAGFIGSELPVEKQPPKEEPFKVYPALSNSEINFSKEPKTVSELEKLMIYMAHSGNYTYSINYSSKYNTDTMTANIKTAFSNVFSKYPEYFSGLSRLSLVHKTTSSNSTLEIKLTSTILDTNTFKENNAKFFNEADNIIKKLVYEGKLKNNMTEKEKAKVLYRWVVLNLKYDQTYSGESYTGYGAVKNKTAVSQGYVSLYNLLLKKVGIEAEGVSGTTVEDNEGHIWTIAKLDGVRYYIDPTFGDPITDKDDYIDMNYFATTEQFLSKTHIWDKAKYR